MNSYIYRMTGGRWKRYNGPKFLRKERGVIEERLQQRVHERNQGDLRQRIEPLHRGAFQPQGTGINGPSAQCGKWTYQLWSKQNSMTDRDDR